MMDCARRKPDARSAAFKERSWSFGSAAKPAEKQRVRSLIYAAGGTLREFALNVEFCVLFDLKWGRTITRILHSSARPSVLLTLPACSLAARRATAPESVSMSSTILTSVLAHGGRAARYGEFTIVTM